MPIGTTPIDTATVDGRRDLANYVVGHYHRFTPERLRFAAGLETRAKINGTPLRMGTLVLLYADVDKLQSLARAGRVGYLRG